MKKKKCRPGTRLIAGHADQDRNVYLPLDFAVSKDDA